MNSKEDTVEFGHYVVAVLDLLGQGDRLAEWNSLPNEVTPEFIQSIKNTVGVVEHFRDGFLSFFEGAKRTNFPDLIKTLSDQQRDWYERYSKCEIKIERLSDTFVFSCPLRNASGDVSTSPVFRIIAACSMAMVWSLAAGVPMRGGVCIGAGLIMDDGSFYGPALAEAHHLENKLAGHPRVLVSPSITEYLAEHSIYSEEPMVNTLMQQTAAACRGMICEDIDGLAMIDFIGTGFLPMFGAPEPQHLNWMKQAFRFACSEAKRFRESGKRELAVRYNLLQQYMVSRLPIWNIQPEEALNDGQ